MRYRPEQIETYWGALMRYSDTIPNTFIRMRRTDRNGKIPPRTHGTTRDVGTCTLANTTDKGNGGNLIQTGTNQDYIRDNARKIQKLQQSQFNNMVYPSLVSLSI